MTKPQHQVREILYRNAIYVIIVHKKTKQKNTYSIKQKNENISSIHIHTCARVVLILWICVQGESREVEEATRRVRQEEDRGRSWREEREPATAAQTPPSLRP